MHFFCETFKTTGWKNTWKNYERLNDEHNMTWYIRYWLSTLSFGWDWITIELYRALQSYRNIMTYTELPSAKATKSRKTCLFETGLGLPPGSSTNCPVHQPIRLAAPGAGGKVSLYIYQIWIYIWVYHFPGCLYMKHPFTKYLHWPQEVFKVNGELELMTCEIIYIEWIRELLVSLALP